MIDERRLTSQLQAYWEKLKGEQRLPFEGDVDVSEIEALWEDCFLVSVHWDNDIDFRYEALGKNLIEVFADGVDIGDLYALLSQENHIVIEKFVEVMEGKHPVIDENHFEKEDGVRVKYRQILLPFTEQGHEEVTYILGGMRWMFV